MIRRTLVVSLCWTAASARADITSNLIARWQFDENAGTITADSSGNGNTMLIGRLLKETPRWPVLLLR
jgi:hypothetical protein